MQLPFMRRKNAKLNLTALWSGRFHRTTKSIMACLQSGPLYLSACDYYFTLVALPASFATLVPPTIYRDLQLFWQDPSQTIHPLDGKLQFPNESGVMLEGETLPPVTALRSHSAYIAVTEASSRLERNADGAVSGLPFFFCVLRSFSDGSCYE